MTGKNKNACSPAELPAFRMEAYRSAGGMTSVISGVIGVSSYSDSEVILSSHGGRIIVSGKRLLICVYENGSVEISGKIEGISFRYGKN